MLKRITAVFNRDEQADAAIEPITAAIVPDTAAIEPDEPRMISIIKLSRQWGCSRNFIWERCKSGEIPATKIGDRWFVPMWWVKEKERR